MNKFLQNATAIVDFHFHLRNGGKLPDFPEYFWKNFLTILTKNSSIFVFYM